jgi:hypothetical protein
MELSTQAEQELLVLTLTEQVVVEQELLAMVHLHQEPRVVQVA